MPVLSLPLLLDSERGTASGISHAALVRRLLARTSSAYSIDACMHDDDAQQPFPASCYTT